MIILRKIKYKNLLSSGNTPIEIKLDESPITLVVGKNGDGKTTFLTAISFALFGKTNRGVNKAQLINSINEKNLLVELEFSVEDNNYFIRRGIKPNIFEIYKNDKLINQESHNKDYQNILENQIIKMNFKTFHQIVILGSSSFIPFMKLPLAQRREVIEELLDIKIFSKMKNILKDRKNDLKNDLINLSAEFDKIDNELEIKKQHFEELKQINRKKELNKSAKIEELVKELELLQKRNDAAREKYPISDKEELNENIQKNKKSIQKLKTYQSQLNTEKNKKQKSITFFQENENCPTCKQLITKEFKQKNIEKRQEKIDELDSALNEIQNQLQTTNDFVQTTEEKLQNIKETCDYINSNLNVINNLQKQINELKNEDSQEYVDENEKKKEFDELYERKHELIKKKENTSINKEKYNILEEILKDTGIKTRIINKYLPVINSLINSYLMTLDFFVKFELDENFKETVKSRHRDVFSYDSFSEGEKSRLDLAIMFTWREVARLKNSVNINLLALDEVAESSLDSEGIENLMKILNDMHEKTNIVLISHRKEVMSDKFDKKLEFYKKGNFSQVKQI